MQISQIHSSKPQIDTLAPTELPLSTQQLADYKDSFQKMNQQKKSIYLQAIKSQNKELVNKIKQLDKRLNVEVDSLRKKIVPSKNKPVIPKLEELETQQLTLKFQEMNTLKQELQLKKTNTDSLEFLRLVKQDQLTALHALQAEISQLKSNISALEKIKKKSQKQQHALKQDILKVGEVNLFGDEISELRKQVKQKNDQIKNKKEAFLNLYKQNHSQRNIKERPPSESNPPEVDQQLAQQKHLYLQMGKKIQQLRLKKSTLLKTLPDPKPHQQLLDKLKLKYIQLSKLSK